MVKVVEGHRLYICPLCGRELTTRNGLKYHLKHVHNLTADDEQYREIMKASSLKRGKKPMVQAKQNEGDREIIKVKKKEESTTFTEDDNENGEEGGIIEEEVSGDKESIEDIKSQLLQLTKEGEEESESEGEYEEGEEEGVIKEVMSIELDEVDVADLYLNILGFVGMIWGYDVYGDTELKNRSVRRARLLKKLIGKYVEDEESIAMLILASDVISDIIYIRSKTKKKEEANEK